jgi:hypothetical protein
MPLSESITTRNLQALIAAPKFRKRDHHIELLTRLNALACEQNIQIGPDAQGDEFNTLLMNRVKSCKSTDDVETYANSLLKDLNIQLEKESKLNIQIAARNGAGYNSVPIHQRALTAQLQDWDMADLMPRSQGNIEVLEATSGSHQPTKHWLMP